MENINFINVSTDYQQKVTTFCEKWQSGQETFDIHTSGSTGVPKLITLTRTQMQASARLTGETFGLKTGDSALVCLNIEYIAGMMMLVRGMELGLNLWIVEPSSNPLLNFTDKNITNITFAAFVPLQLQTILTETPHFTTVLNQMKAIIVGGAAVNQSLQEQIKTLQVPVYSTYGMTETVSHIAIRRLNGENSSEYFKLLEGVSIDLDDRNCLKIQAVASNFEWIQTNDVVELIDNQHFKLIGRADNIINSGGVKIQLEKIEKLIDIALKATHQVIRFFAWGLPDEKLGQKLVIIFEGNENEVIYRLLQEIKFENPYHKPKSIHFCSQLKETPTGKIDKIATIKSIIP